MADDQLWSITQVAEYFGVSESRARHIVADNGVERVAGYPATLIRAIKRPGQGARTDLRKKD
jgi:hypothetical protein